MSAAASLLTDAVCALQGFKAAAPRASTWVPMADGRHHALLLLEAALLRQPLIAMVIRRACHRHHSGGIVRAFEHVVDEGGILRCRLHRDGLPHLLLFSPMLQPGKVIPPTRYSAKEVREQWAPFPHANQALGRLATELADDAGAGAGTPLPCPALAACGVRLDATVKLWDGVTYLVLASPVSPLLPGPRAGRVLVPLPSVPPSSPPPPPAPR